MCFGKRFVTIILGDDSQTKVSCGFCERGCEGSTGTATVWEPSARIETGVISGKSTRYGIKYEVGYRTVSASNAFSNAELAESERVKQYALMVEVANKYFQDSFVNCKRKQVWSAGYHKNCIASSERAIKWHRLRLGMIEERDNK
jgi:hypothetical protein